ncbi:MAG: LOG family protein, partial [Desulfovibrionales bacterium]|nr:LOG family protein [Desulfovibrionales bacterium]
KGQLSNLNPLLNDPLSLFEKGDEVGRLVVMDPKLRIRDVRHYLHKRLFVGKKQGRGCYDGFDIHREIDPVTGHGADYITVAPESFQYLFEPHAISLSGIGRVIKKGRSALGFIRSRTAFDLNQAVLEPGALFVGGIKISLGDIYGIIDTCIDLDGVAVLPSRVLDPFRTFRERQVVFYNRGKDPVPLGQIRVKIRFFKAKNPLTVPLEKAKIKEGYRLCDLLTTSEVADLFSGMGPDDLGVIINRNNYARVPRALDVSGEAQLEILRNALLESTYRRAPISRRVNAEFLKILEKLSVVGGVNSRLFVGDEFPSLNGVEALGHSGLRTFLVRGGDHPAFNDDYIKQMIRLSHRGQDRCEFLRYNSESDKVYTFYHGCFMEPNDRVRFDRVRYWFAFYGSHTHKADNQLTLELIRLLACELGPNMGIVHGGGPGLMKEANDLARQHNIMSVGVAIELEGENQASLTTCDGLIKYREGLRLARQDHLQKLSNLPVVNTGGYGSAEELAISITSMKIHENPLAPIVLLDPDNLWSHAREQTRQIALKKYGPAFTPHLIQSCSSALDASRVLLGFLSDPDAWYQQQGIPRENVERARIKSQRIRGQSLALERVEVFDRPRIMG